MSILIGAPAISAFLGSIGFPLSEDSVRRYAERPRDPLPCERYLGRLRTEAKDVEAWAKKQLRAVSAASAGK